MRESAGKIKDHPLFIGYAEDEGNEGAEKALESIHNYKPKQSKKMAFSNPYTASIQHIIDYAKMRYASTAAKETAAPLKEEAKPEIPSPPPLIPAPAIHIAHRAEKQRSPQIDKKRAHPEDFKDPANYISHEATKSQEKLRQVKKHSKHIIVVGR